MTASMAQPAAVRWRQRAANLARVLLSLGIIAYILRSRQIDPAVLLQHVRQSSPGWIAAAFAWFGLVIALCIVRWHLMLQAQGLQLGLGRSALITLIGVFFNSFMLGSTGGDVVKAYYAARQTRHLKAEAITSVVADRIVGLLGLFLLAALSIAWRWREAMADPLVRLPLLTLLGGFALILGLLLLFGQRAWWSRLARFGPLEQLLRHVPAALRRAIVRFYDALHLYQRRGGLLAVTLLCSVAVHSAIAVSAACIGRSLGVEVGTGFYFLTIPLINLFSAVPISISGLGVRDQLVVHFFTARGVESSLALALSLIAFALVLAWSLVGGLVYMLVPSTHLRPADSADDDDAHPRDPA